MSDTSFSTSRRVSLSRLLGLLLLAYVLLAAPPVPLSPWMAGASELAGFAMLVVAAFGRVWCLAFVGGKKNNVLVMEGPYSVTRNPLYVFSFIGAVGFGLAVENPCLALVMGGAFAAYYPFAVRREERVLAAAFGDAYAAYRARTPRWFPDFRLYHEPESLSIPPDKIRKAILDAMWFVWAFFLWELVELLRGTGAISTLF